MPEYVKWIQVRTLSVSPLHLYPSPLRSQLIGPFGPPSPSPHFHIIQEISFVTIGYRIFAANEFSGKIYACEDLPLGSQDPRCDGRIILELTGLRENDIAIPFISLAVYFAILIVITSAVLQFFPYTGPKHARPISSTKAAKAGEVKKEGETNAGGHAAIDVNGENAAKKSFQRVSIMLRDLSLSVAKVQRRLGKPKALHAAGEALPGKLILDNITARFPQGELTVILGSSGAGKSTLLNVLTGRRMVTGPSTRVVTRGSIRFNDIEVMDLGPNRASQVRSVVSFVRQDDNHLLPALTARETLRYAAKLRLPAHMSMAEKTRRAEEVLMLLGLKDCANTIVGNEMIKGLSGGEKRRLSIGIQMLADPSVLVIDEPTSGLDSFTANNIMVTLKDLARSGRTVISSIHQPRSDIFTLFDNIVLLARGGRVAYSGRSTSFVDYFASINHTIPAFTNPADVALDLTSIDLRNEEQEKVTRARVDDIIAQWRSRGTGKVGDPGVVVEGSARRKGGAEEAEKEERMGAVVDAVDRDIEKLEVAVEDEGDEALGYRIEHRVRTRFHIAYPVLVHRSFTNIRRQFDLVLARVMQVFSLGVILALFHARMKLDQPYVQSRVGLLQQFLSVAFVGMLNCIAVFPQELTLFKFERHDNSYTVAAFFMSYTTNEVPFELLASALFVVFAQIVVGLKTTVTTFFTFTFVVFCLVACGESLGIAFCSMVQHVGFSVQVMSAAITILTMLAGFLSVQSIPNILDWINYASPLRWAARIVAVQEFSGLQLECSGGPVCIYRTGEDVLRLFAFKEEELVLNVVVLAGLTIVYRAISFLVLTAKTK
ncbi:hypothetical protein HK102_000867 [Quaeritorhiza haematococci]|nr:hypothetical protein HK102_000867 [Quaeritorhiza haematococci]